ncbi:MAG: DNA-binding protein [Desulfurellales bacterium]|nr:MAG: DNA-binding protein [Desulfurellales bacterium]
MTVPEAARELAVSRSHLYQLAQTGKIPVRRIGRAVRIPVAWVKTAKIPEGAGNCTGTN